MDTSYGIEGHTKKMGSTSANPYGMWMLPAYERHRLQMMQKRMNLKVMPLEANLIQNKELERNRPDPTARATTDPTSNGSNEFFFDLGNNNREKRWMSMGKENLRKESGTEINNSGSCFAVLVESSEEVNMDLDFLKQRIKNLTTGQSLGATRQNKSNWIEVGKLQMACTKMGGSHKGKEAQSRQQGKQRDNSFGPKNTGLGKEHRARPQSTKCHRPINGCNSVTPVTSGDPGPSSCTKIMVFKQRHKAGGTYGAIGDQRQTFTIGVFKRVMEKSGNREQDELNSQGPHHKKIPQGMEEEKVSGMPIEVFISH